jgi:hypothetical protein
MAYDDKPLKTVPRHDHRGRVIGHELVEPLPIIRSKPEPMKPHMVTCKTCGLLVGWASEPVTRFYCIPCFDHVPIIEDDGARERQFQQGLREVEDTFRREKEAEAVEAKAKEIYEGWCNDPGYSPWVEGGNSHRQNAARDAARKILSL